MLDLAITGLAMLCCFPLAARYQQKHANNPKTLPKDRRRLSVSSSCTPANEACFFLQMLPIELRQEIYKLVLGGKLIHIFQVHRQIRHRSCQLYEAFEVSSESTGIRSLCCPGFTRFMVCSAVSEGIEQFSNGQTAILRTCREIYMEAIRVLYTTNRFEFDQLAAFRFLAKTITPQRFASIASLQIDWCMIQINSEEQWTRNSLRIIAERLEWKKACHLMATRMTGLLHFRLIVRKLDPRLPANMQEDKEWFKPLLELKGLRTFHLNMFEFSFPFVNLQTPEKIRLETGLRELLCQTRPRDDRYVPEMQESSTSRKRGRNVMRKSRPQPVGGLVNLDKRMIEMMDLIGPEQEVPERDRED